MNVFIKKWGCLFLLAITLTSGCDWGPGSEFLGKWVNTKNPSETVEIVRSNGLAIGPGETWFQLSYDGVVSKAYLGDGCACIVEQGRIQSPPRFDKNSNLGSLLGAWMDRQWQYDKNSDTLSLRGARGGLTYRRAK